MPSPPTTADNFKWFQELFKRMADDLKIALEEVLEAHELLDILETSSTSKIIIPINKTLMESAKTVWQTPATIPPTCKKTGNKYYVPSKGTEFLFTPHTKFTCHLGGQPERETTV